MYKEEDMSKKVLILSASPRKGGNSDTLCDEFLKGVQDAGNIGEKIFLRDKKINYCTGCGLCNTNNYTACSQKDDMAEILEKMIEADVIVMATPVYFYTMDAQLKTLIDRCCARYTHITNKDFYFIATAADGRRQALERTFDGLRGFTACLDNVREAGIIYGAGVWEKSDVQHTNLLKEAYETGKNI